MRTCNTLIECTGYKSFEEAGGAIDVHNKIEEHAYNYRPFYVSKGIVVGVYVGSRLVGYLEE